MATTGTPGNVGRRGSSRFAADGTRLAVHHSGEGPGRVFLAHATGFCGRSLDGLRSVLGDRPTTIWDFRGHGRSGPAPVPISWWEIAGDTAAVRGSAAAETAIGFGHSMGGVTLVMAQLADPARFSGLVLFEPIIFAGPFRRRDHRLARLAEKRRRSFPSREEAGDNFASKAPFDTWLPAALEGYLTDGLRERDASVELACRPELEAEVYRSAAAHGVYARLSELRVPVTLVVGEDSDTYPSGWVERLAAAVPDVRLVRVPGTHFAPMEHPEPIADEIRALMDRVMGSDG